MEIILSSAIKTRLYDAQMIARRALISAAAEGNLRRVLGQNIFGLAEWELLYGVNPVAVVEGLGLPLLPDWQIGLNDQCPICGKIKKDCHFAFLGLPEFQGKPLNFLRLMDMHPGNGAMGNPILTGLPQGTTLNPQQMMALANQEHQPRFLSYPPTSWFSNEPWMTGQSLQYRWYLGHQQIHPQSTRKTWEEQLAILPAGYRPPFAVEETAKLIFYFRRNSIYLNTFLYSRCADETIEGYRPIVGVFSGAGVHTGNAPDIHKYVLFGLSPFAV